jgi:hypothetical protein
MQAAGLHTYRVQTAQCLKIETLFWPTKSATQPTKQTLELSKQSPSFQYSLNVFVPISLPPTISIMAFASSKARVPSSTAQTAKVAQLKAEKHGLKVEVARLRRVVADQKDQLSKQRAEMRFLYQELDAQAEDIMAYEDQHEKLASLLATHPRIGDILDRLHAKTKSKTDE